ncbi:DNA polymerase I [Parablautia intestinalis]|uniref:DNA polymerase I n=1 Tax=Parablautia intestinalis TaxID=2320100 RepID=A0A3A9AMU5_9FIRM|nr:DNA polymerase I [Parablautia intestinalis]RKI92890.1 DNA polymerase I [Parablautia intestinalis]
MEKIVLIDGHSILNRAFYGVPDLTNSAGLHTNAVYGFLNILFKILEEESPDYLTVAFDVKAPTFRHEIYKEYKGTRKPMPEELRQQVPALKEVLTAMGIKMMEKAGLEADDILGTLAKKAEKEGMEVSLVSGDRDLLQIATDVIKIRIPKTKGGKTEIEDYYAADVKEKYQVTPTAFIELKALMGDTADNIPGVPKVGEKTATELMVQFGTLENLYTHVDEVGKKSVRESLINNKELAYLSKTLAEINVDSPLDFSFEEARVHDFYTEEAYVVFKKLEFKNLLSRFEKGISNDSIIAGFQMVSGLPEAEEVFGKALESGGEVGFAILKDSTIKNNSSKGGKTGGFAGIALGFDSGRCFFIQCTGLVTEEYLRGKMAEVSSCTKLCCGDIKGAYDYLMCDDTQRFFDVILAAYLLNPLKNDYTIADVANEHLGLMIPEQAQRFGKASLLEALSQKPEEFTQYACFLAYVALKAAPVLREKLDEAGMLTLMNEIEMPLTYVLYDMEKEGILVKPQELKAYGEALTGRISELEQKIYKEAGTEFNINSPKQLGEILFDKLALPGGKKTKTGYSTAADVLEKLAPDHIIVADVLEYRGLAKLKSTYAEGLSAYIGEDNRIHSTFNQTITATGRISSTDPNLQNIPMRMELGRQIRKVFIPKEGCIFTDADYSQIELRILAHMSGDGQLIDAYRMHADIHRITASQVFHIPFDEVTDLQRRNAKAVNFGIVYGISSFGLSQGLSITKKEAAEYIEKYFATYPGVKNFLDKSVKDAREKGYVTTLFGRRRPVPELSSSNFMQRSFGERVAMNSPIQGTAADVIKIAMIKVHQRLKKEKLASKLILQVHDELLIETKKEEADKVQLILEEEMSRAAQLSVRLEIDLHEGNDWYEAK